MDTIPLHDAFYYLKTCTGVLLEGRYIEPYLFELEDDYGNEFMILEWDEHVNGDLVTVMVTFKEGDNQTVGKDGSVLILQSTDDEEELVLLREWDPDDIL